MSEIIPGAISAALVNLESGDVQSRVRAVEELARSLEAVATRVASSFEVDDEARSLIFERLSWFGSIIIPPMEDVFARSITPHVRLMAASALLYLGSRVGVEDLIREVVSSGPDLCMSVISLADAQIVDAIDPIEDAIISCDLSDNKIIECLVSSLKKLKMPLSQDVRARLSGVEPDWYRKSLLD
jgi:hypothetical protein